MSWQDKIDFDHCNSSQEPVGGHRTSSSEPLETRSLSAMTPGLTNTYDDELREKAGAHTPPPPPECMGLEGEYDDYGLVRRVAQALDRDPRLTNVETVTLTQHGSTVELAGQVGDRKSWEHLIEVVSRVDGTRSVDSRRLVVSSRG